MLFNFATKTDIKALSDQNTNACALNSTRIQLLEDRIGQLKSDLKQNIRAQYDLNMGVQDKNELHIKRLEDRILDLENPKPKEKKPAVKAKK